MRIGQWIKLVVKFAVSGGILFVLLKNLGSDSIAKTLAAVSVTHILLLLVCYLGIQLLCTYKWQTLAQSMGFQGSLKTYFDYYLKGMFFGLFLPTGIGGDVGRAMLLCKAQNRRWMQGFLSTLAERLCGLTGILIFVCLGMNVFRPPEWSWGLVAGLGLFALITLGVTLFFQKIEHHPLGHKLIQRFVLHSHEEEDTHWPTKNASMYGILLSLIAHSGLALLQILILHWLGAPVPFLLMATISGLAGLATMIPISLSGIGLREGTLVLLLSHWGGVPVDVATSYSLIWLSTLVLAAIPGGLLLLRSQVMVPKNI